MRGIRPAEAADVGVVRSIVRAAYAGYMPRVGREPGPMQDDYAALVAAGCAHVLVGADELCGVIVLVPEPDCLLVDNVAVSPAAQRLGHGRAPVTFAEETAREAGIRAIRLYANEAMTENLALYGRLGFVETHRAAEKGFNRVFMRKHLDPFVR